MSAGLSLPSRPRAVRVIGSPPSPPSSDAAALTQDLQSFIRQQRTQALQVLEDWLDSDSPPTARPTQGLPPSRAAASPDRRTHDDGQEHYACN